jgi:prephenate dehydrogenase
VAYGAAGRLHQTARYPGADPLTRSDETPVDAGEQGAPGRLPEARPLRVAVLGVGLIGGSIGLAARDRAGAQVCGYDPDERVRALALELGAIDEQTADIAGAVRGADVVFVAAPVGALVETVREALTHAGPGCVVSDVGSTKRAVAAASVADERFIGGHPLAGAETAGVEHARADLFDGATWYLTPARASTPGVLYERLHRLLTSFGAQPAAIDADTHDRLMAFVSHLPHVLANLLVAQAASALGGKEDQRLPAVGPSFRDATRVAGANTAIWTDIYLSNRDALIAGIDGLTERLGDVRAALQQGDAAAVADWNERARVDREALLGAGLAGEAGGEPVLELRASVPNRPGAIAELALALGQAGVNIVDMALSPSEDNRQGVVALWVGGEPHAARALELISDLGFPVARA